MSTEQNQKIVTRFAPSPTGLLHTGTVRTAIFAWAWARKYQGTFILRIEDTDKVREVEGGVKNIMETLTWLGMDWDYGPNKIGPFGSCIQSERLDVYKKYAQILIDAGLAYADPYTKEELEVFRKEADAYKIPFLYRTHRPENPPKWDGTQPLRFKTTLKRYTWNDVVRGTLSAPEEVLDDVIIIKSDGYPTYNFAHIVDDIEMGVTHVMRGEEFIASMPNFLALYEAFKKTPPFFVTLPPVLRSEGGKKLSKRAGAKSILEFQIEGYLPEAICNFLVFQGWNPGDEREVMSVSEFVQEFDITKIQKSGAKYNEEKLDWFNKEHMKRLSPQENYARLFAYFDQEELNDEIRSRIKRLLPTAYDHSQIYSDFYTAHKNGEYDYVNTEPVYEKQKLVWKEDSLQNTKLYLEKIYGLLKEVDENNWTAEHLKQVIWDYVESVGRGNVLWPLRFLLSGKDKSPDPFTLLYVLGKKESLARITHTVASL